MLTSTESDIRPRTVFMDHDGNPEDSTSMMLLLGMRHINVIGVSITEADCFIHAALETTLKILSLYDRKIEVGVGNIDSFNPFPEPYRVSSILANNSPILINQYMDKSLIDTQPAHLFMARKIREHSGPVTVLLTGPATHLTAALESDPSIKDKIEEVVWMAGAVDAPGNLKKFDHDGSAEWNVHWDPMAGKKLLDTGLNITIFPLDVTNQVPINVPFLKRLAKTREEYNMIDLVGQFYAICYHQSPNSMDVYYMWDTLCTSYLGCPGLIQEFRMEQLDILTEKPSAGNTVRKPNNDGRFVKVAYKVDREILYEFFIKTLQVKGKIIYA